MPSQTQFDPNRHFYGYQINNQQMGAMGNQSYPVHYNPMQMNNPNYYQGPHSANIQYYNTYNPNSNMMYPQQYIKAPPSQMQTSKPTFSNSPLDLKQGSLSDKGVFLPQKQFMPSNQKPGFHNPAPVMMKSTNMALVENSQSPSQMPTAAMNKRPIPPPGLENK